MREASKSVRKEIYTVASVGCGEKLIKTIFSMHRGQILTDDGLFQNDSWNKCAVNIGNFVRNLGIGRLPLCVASRDVAPLSSAGNSQTNHWPADFQTVCRPARKPKRDAG